MGFKSQRPTRALNPVASQRMDCMRIAQVRPEISVRAELVDSIGPVPLKAAAASRWSSWIRLATAGLHKRTPGAFDGTRVGSRIGGGDFKSVDGNWMRPVQRDPSSDVDAPVC